MKKLLFISICMAGVMMACTNKGKTAPGEGSDSDSVAIDSMEIVEEVDTIPMPMFIFMMSPKSMMMCYWEEKDSIEKNFRRNRALYTKLLNQDNKCLGIKYIGEQLKDPDGDDATYGELHGREEIPAAGLKYAFTDKVNASNMSGVYVAVTDDYLATRKLIDMKYLDVRKSLPKDVIKKLEAEYKMKHENSVLVAQGNKYSYGVLQFAGKYKTVKEFGEKADKCLALEVLMAGDKVYSFPVEGYLYGGQPSWHAEDDGEYFPCSITLFEAPNDALEIAFTQGAPESITTGMFYVRDGKMTQQKYTVYHAMNDENMPLWKKDAAQLQKLYDAYVKSSKHKFSKYRWIDVDNDEKDEVWVRAEDDTHGALFKQIGGKWKLLAIEDGDENTLDEILPEGIGIWWIDIKK